MLLGVAVGTVATLLFRRGPSGGRPMGAAMRAAGAGVDMATPYARSGMRWAGRRAAAGAGWARDRGEELWDRADPEAIADEVGDYMSHAREAVNEAVQNELSDLRKAIRRRRKRLGL